MPGSSRLVDRPWAVVEVDCSLCRKHGRCRLARPALAAPFPERPRGMWASTDQRKRAAALGEVTS